MNNPPDSSPAMQPVTRCPSCGHTRGSDHDCDNVFHASPAMQPTDTKCFCGTPVEERSVREAITWGTDGVTEHDRHVFEDIEQRYSHCPKCDEDFFTWEQAQFRERNLNEAIKAKLGIDRGTPQ